MARRIPPTYRMSDSPNSGLLPFSPSHGPHDDACPRDGRRCPGCGHGLNVLRQIRPRHRDIFRSRKRYNTPEHHNDAPRHCICNDCFITPYNLLRLKFYIVFARQPCLIAAYECYFASDNEICSAAPDFATVGLTLLAETIDAAQANTEKNVNLINRFIFISAPYIVYFIHQAYPCKLRAGSYRPTYALKAHDIRLPYGCAYSLRVPHCVPERV